MTASGVAMSRSNAIVLLVCFLLSTVMTGTVHATGCTPVPTGTQMCIATDKTTYTPGENIIFTVEVTAKDSPTSTATYPILLVPSPIVPGTTTTTYTSVTVHYAGGTIWTGSGSLTIPTNATLGDYVVQVLYYKNGSCCSVGGATYITVTS